jgi:hypothetical protein
MNVVTIFNYPNKSFPNFMQRFWLAQVNKFGAGANVYLITGNHGISDYVMDFIDNRCDKINIEIVHGERDPNEMKLKEITTKRNILFNAHNIMKFGKSLSESIIFIDADAFVFHPLSELWQYADDKPFIGTSHAAFAKYLNAGVLTISDWSFMDYDKMMETFIENKSRYKEIIKICSKLPWSHSTAAFLRTGGVRGGGFQSFLTSYFISNDYHPYYDKVTKDWNWFGRHAELKYSESRGWYPTIPISKAKKCGVTNAKVLHYYSNSKGLLKNHGVFKEYG